MKSKTVVLGEWIERGGVSGSAFFSMYDPHRCQLILFKIYVLLEIYDEF
jgi:hypothetical protein